MGESQNVNSSTSGKEYGTESGNHHYHAISPDTSQGQNKMRHLRKQADERTGNLLVRPHAERLGDFKKSGRIQAQTREKRRVQTLLSRPKERDAHFFVGIQLGGLMGDYLVKVLELISGKPSSVIKLLRLGARRSRRSRPAWQGRARLLRP